MDTDNKNYNFRKIKTFKYGENQHQKASLFSFDKELDYSILNGCELSYNNILDLTKAIEVSAEFFDVASCTIVKHANLLRWRKTLKEHLIKRWIQILLHLLTVLLHLQDELKNR